MGEIAPKIGRSVSFWRRKRCDFLLRNLSKDSVILDIGSGDGWVGQFLLQNGFKNCVSIDLNGSATYTGDIRNWRELGLKPESFDAIVAFEVLEHVSCVQDCFDLLRPGGKMLITTPLPSGDPILKIFERLGLTQSRTSPHDNLILLSDVRLFGVKRIHKILGLSQWAVFAK